MHPEDCPPEGNPAPWAILTFTDAREVQTWIKQRLSDVRTDKSGNPVRFCGNRNIDLGELQTEENPGRVQRPKTILDDYDDR